MYSSFSSKVRVAIEKFNRQQRTYAVWWHNFLVVLFKALFSPFYARKELDTYLG